VGKFDAPVLKANAASDSQSRSINEQPSNLKQSILTYLDIFYLVFSS
jgi:hypothetical protein